MFFLLTAFSTKTLTTSYSLQGSLSHQRKKEHDRSVAILITKHKTKSQYSMKMWKSELLKNIYSYLNFSFNLNITSK